ncbi:unnamed protein product, partial [Ixodes persulcatus]
IPKYDPFTIGVIPFTENLTRKHKVCKHKDPPVVFRDTNVPMLDEFRVRNIYKISTTNVSCFYSRVTRNRTATSPDNSFALGPESSLSFGRPLPDEFVKIRCTSSHAEFYSGFHLIPQLKRSQYNASSDHMNVLILGMDSVSRLNMNRRLPHSSKFVRESLEAFELVAYNKIGENTFPNLMALLSGLSEEEVASMTKNRTFDHVPFLWTTFKRKGYQTVFMEEMPEWPLFIHPAKKGFRRRPTDYYPFPIVKAFYRSFWRMSGCSGTRLISEIYLDYITDLIILMRQQRFFVFLWLGDWSHSDFNAAGIMDGPLRDFLEKLSSRGVFGNTALFFLSDHGARSLPILNTPIGAHEVNLPFFFLSVPAWFKNKFPGVVESLRVNRNRLTTPYDVHATIRSLTSLPDFDPRPTARGLNLFRQVPSWRTCEEALIPFQFCACERAEERITDNSMARPYALLSLAFINTEAQRHFPGMCATWTLDAVLDATIMRGVASKARWFRVVFTTQPKGQFQVFGTLHLKVGSKKKPVEFVERMDWYSNRTRCLPPSVAQKLCSCKGA